MKKNKKRNTAGALSSLLDVPLDILADVPRITLNDNREMTIENYKSIEGYEQDRISLRSKNYRITITGKKLEIVAITDDEIFIKGIISGLAMT